MSTAAFWNQRWKVPYVTPTTLSSGSGAQDFESPRNQDTTDGSTNNTVWSCPRLVWPNKRSNPLE
eukprot:14606656-Heterocapsa_arctica.AAC.1